MRNFNSSKSFGKILFIASLSWGSWAICNWSHQAWVHRYQYESSVVSVYPTNSMLTGATKHEISFETRHLNLVVSVIQTHEFVDHSQKSHNAVPTWSQTLWGQFGFFSYRFLTRLFFGIDALTNDWNWKLAVFQYLSKQRFCSVDFWIPAVGEYQ